MTGQEIESKIMEILKTKDIREPMAIGALSKQIDCDDITVEKHLQILQSQNFIKYLEKPYLGIIDINQGNLFQIYFQDKE